MVDKSMGCEIKEQISVLVDGELTGNEIKPVLDGFDVGMDAKDSWSSYHTISDALHNNLPSHISPFLADRVSAQLANEPVLNQSSNRNKLLKFPVLFKPVAGFALAASVSAIAIMSVQSVGRDGLNSAPATETLAVSQQIVNYNQDPGESGATDHALAKEFEHYLVDHTEYSVAMNVQGALPYVRLVNHITTQ
ncbi:sigma-E factor negative regulatory protein [Candidatus Pacearchaeota archaeon]|nr:sigma-E factor negative regulatory protein [Candidatus Pacearchaeota archaeon]